MISTHHLRNAVLAQLADEARSSSELAGRAIGDSSPAAASRAGHAAAALAARGLAIRMPLRKHVVGWQITTAGKAALEGLTGKAPTP